MVFTFEIEGFFMPIISVYNCSCCDKLFRLEEKTEYISHLRVHVVERRIQRKRDAIVEKVKDFFSSREVTGIRGLFSNIDLFKLYVEYVSLRDISEFTDIEEKYAEAIPSYNEVTGQYRITDGYHILHFCKNGLSIPSKFTTLEHKKITKRFMPGLPENGELYMSLGNNANVPIAIKFKDPSPKTLATLKMYG